MPLSRIDEIYIYTYPSKDQLETYTLYNQLDNLGIPYNKLEYNDPSQHPVLFDALNTWWQEDENRVKQEPITEFPFVVYTEVHSGRPVSYLPRKYIVGASNIIAQLPDLYKLGR